MKGIQRGLATRIRLPRWFLWAFLVVSASVIVVVAAKNWTEVNTTTPANPEEFPLLPELVGPPDGAVVVPPVTLAWAMPLGPGPVEVRVHGPGGRLALVQTCLVDSLTLLPELLGDPGRYRWQVVPRGVSAGSCPARDFLVRRDLSAPAP
jgi:hypothetical protein